MDTALSWIKAYVPELECTAQEYTDAMTLSGTKVESFHEYDKNLDKIVVGEILKIERHPDADKLVICQVNIGSETIQIVTGAPNVKEGQKVPVVLDGGRVAGGHDGSPLPENGIKIMSINLLLDDEEAPVIWRGPVIAGVVKQFWNETVWGDVDYLFVDMPPGTGDVPLTVFQSLPVDGIVIVTSPQELVQMIVKRRTTWRR